MEISQGNSLYSYLKQTKMSFFFFCKIGGQNRSCLGGIGTSGREEEVGKGCGKVNIVQILCTHVWKWKMIPIETIPRTGGGGDKVEW
jgi:hypothetical protein